MPKPAGSFWLLLSLCFALSTEKKTRMIAHHPSLSLPRPPNHSDAGPRRAWSRPLGLCRPPPVPDLARHLPVRRLLGRPRLQGRRPPQAQAAGDAHGQEARARLLVQASARSCIVRAGIPQGACVFVVGGIGGCLFAGERRHERKKLVVDERSALLETFFFSFFFFGLAH